MNAYFRTLSKMFDSVGFMAYQPEDNQKCSCGLPAEVVIYVDNTPIIFCGLCALDFVISRAYSTGHPTTK